jgi:3-hydroxyacyl-CoA dehydrogenase
VDVNGMERIAAIVGGGLIGRSWAMVFARAGWAVRVFDNDATQLASARERIALALREQQAAGLVTDATAALARIAVHERLADALAGSAWVCENLPEEVDVKRQVFRDLDALAPPDAILASSTSAIVPSRFTEGLAGRARCLVAHPVNPPHLVPVVELCGAPWTADATVARADGVMREVGQVPVRVRREIDGFILNRLQGALLSEAMRLVEEGFVSPQDLDRTIADGLGLRWSFLGPFATIELNAPGGVADYCARYSGLYRRLAASAAPPEVWDAENVGRVVAELGAPLTQDERERRMAWRDRRLATLVAHKRNQPKNS